MMRQVGALPYRRRKGAGMEVLLVSSRRTRRWIIPKGNIDPGRDERTMAGIEALEEAGVEGKVLKKPLGTYEYLKYFDDGATEPSEVTVYALSVRTEHADWLERGERERMWVSPFVAGELVEEPGLAAILLTFAVTHRDK
jgi:8-oxo-dGTP pyrophosphatase MutT (NUDIX family)